MKMFEILEKHLEDSDYPSLGPVVLLFKVTTLWAPSRTRIQSIIYHCLLVFVAIISLNQLAYLIIMRKTEMFTSYVQYSTYPLSVIKIFTYHIWHKKWELIIEELSHIEKEMETDPKCKEVLEQYKNRGRAVVLFYLIIGVGANIIFIINAWLSVALQLIYNVPSQMRTRIFFIWWPFSVEKRQGWLADMFLQTVYADICSIYILAWDSLLLLMLIVFAGHMQLVTMKFKHSLDSGTGVERKKNIIRCHQIHVSVLKLQGLCNSVLSPPLFVHLLSVSLNIAVSIGNMKSDNPAQIASALIFMGGLLFQLVLYYWHGNEFTVQSELVSYSLFESEWVDKTLDIKRLIAVVSIFTTKLVYFSAGPFSRISLSTFVSVLRASYSFYTLMKETA